MNRSRQMMGGIVFAAAAAAMVAMPVFVSPSQGQEDAAPKGPSLSAAMRAMGGAYGKIRSQYKDATKNDSTLEYLATFETNALAARAELPPTITGLADDDAKKKAAADYRLKLNSVVRAALDLEDELAAGDADKAAASVTAMGDIEKAGHAAYRPKRGG